MRIGDMTTSVDIQHARTTPRSNQQKILHACKQKADEYIEILIKQVLDKLDDALTNRAINQGDDSDTPDYAAAERDLNAKRSEIISNFLVGVTQNNNARLRQIGSADSFAKMAVGQSSDLSLVDEKKLEEYMAVDGLVGRAKDLLRNELDTLAQRFNVLIELAKYNEESLPFDPEVICYAFRDVVQKIELRVEIKLIAYNSFEQGVMQTLGQFYIQLNSLLSTAGVLPGLKLPIPLRLVGGTHHAHHLQHKSEGHAGDELQEKAQWGGYGKIQEVELNDQVVTPDRLIFETVEARLEGVEVPNELRDFLRNVWSGVLRNVLDQDGYESEAWRHSEKTLDDLIWSVEPKITVNDRRKMVKLLPRLLDALRKGMNEVGCSQRQIDELIDTLEPIHMTCLHFEKRDEPAILPDVRVDHISEDSHAEESNKVTTVRDESPDIGEPIVSDDKMQVAGEMSEFEKELLGMDVSIVQEEPDHSDPEPVDIDDEFTTMAAEMSVGTWLEFDLGDKKRRGKLAWKSVVMGEYVYVDRKNKVVAEKTLAGLVADLRSGKASLVENVPMVDRALDKVLNGLMSGNRTNH